MDMMEDMQHKKKSEIDELLSDFKTCLKMIDFNHYRPTSGEVVNAINTGLLWKLMKCVQHDEKKHKKDEDEKVEIKEINDELLDSKKYLTRYKNVGDGIYHDLARQELHHAELLINRAKERMVPEEYQKAIKPYEDWYLSLHAEINGVR